MVPFSVTLSERHSKVILVFYMRWCRAMQLWHKCSIKLQKLPQMTTMFISKPWPTFFDVLSRKGSYLFPQLLTTNKNSYFIEKPMVLFSITFSDFVKVISRSSYFSTSNNVAASRSLLAIAKFLLELWYTEVVQSDEWISISECSAFHYTRS